MFVPVPAGRLREALSDPERVARAVPGLQQDAGTPPVAGRLKVRVAGHTITYRGTLRVTAQDDGTYAVEGDATEARGTGSVKLTLTLRLIPATDGTTIAFEGTATADGRITELDTDTVTAAGARLLGKFAENLGGGVAEEERKEEEAREERKEEEAREERGAQEEAHTAVEAEPVAEGPEHTDGEDGEDDESVASVYDAEVPPPSLDPFTEGDFVASGEPPAEAAHARRTMIGRSAEEVDHAPPRGRYAPVPAAETVSAGTALRWAAPAAALAVASAIIVGRALRKRR
ncbi:hypothetical protein GCM10017771_66570 [Streptomyces capitiformicae]|uniref:Carbon monoxide dehydrogenase subunit G n=1 Tax=Streptomyces capitiformicae TaxID=2014920 RepID=A0A919DIU4_9ACTN|nr:hypothetical protein GCM10017771_66570 [Streptomyces capitiformicae]